jgi:hypothetical protein
VLNPALYKEVTWGNGHAASQPRQQTASRTNRFTHLEEYRVSTEQAAKWVPDSVRTQWRRRKSFATIRGLLAPSVATIDYTRVPFIFMIFYYYYHYHNYLLYAGYLYIYS